MGEATPNPNSSQEGMDPMNYASKLKEGGKSGKKDSRKGGGGGQPSVTSNRFEVFNLDPGPSERNSGEGVNNVEELGADTHERGTVLTENINRMAGSEGASTPGYLRRRDVSIWQDDMGVERKFSVHTVWETIRYRSMEVDWFNIVWFTYCIPRHAFHVWLVCRKKLNTQDKMRKWDMNMRCCPLCVKDMDSHEHLFFECEYARQVWGNVRSYTSLGHIEGVWESIVGFLNTRGNWKSTESIIDRLVVGATAYYVWQERNARIFTDIKRRPTQITKIILDTVRLKLVSMREGHVISNWKTRKRWDLERIVFT
ncbi:hypothetical protein QVD17_41505 [Tagetes erecta]|uniref:Reverse transcriptase zinc-binding domain-containing protein n=1 Tax=Tagetes erecta TaxID=13708 RepID=A0AAD8NFL7_TARER|nr:hypothetical protein QVD17_41505 [Tagetes erecta]